MNLEELRAEINEIDDELLKLFSKRMNIALKVAEYKKEHHLPVLNSEREREILNKVASKSEKELKNYTRVLFTTLFDLSKSYQNKYMKKDHSIIDQIEEAKKAVTIDLESSSVACQGIEGAYSGIAAEKLFSSPSITYLNTFDSVFHAVDKGLCKYGILPIENTTAGSVGQVYDLMKKYNCFIVKSVRLKIDHNLLAKKGTTLNDIKEIYSHEQAIQQCSNFLENNKHIKVNICENTAVAASLVSRSNRLDLAAISSKRCADLYELSILSNNILNSDHNYTRFICISKNLEFIDGADKISFMASLKHQPGSLYNLISKFAAQGLNLTKLESRTIQGKDFEFMFYFDIKASIFEEDILSLIADIQSATEEFAFLGAYKEII